MMTPKTSAVLSAALLAAGAVLTAIGKPERDVSLTSAGELWADFFRDADRFGLQLSRVSAKDEVDFGNLLAGRIPAGGSSWQAYVDAVGQQVARQASRKDIPYTFHVLPGQAENAFSLPGGHVFIYEGLLQSIHNEAELAAVLGHEIAHVDARHCIERFQYELRLKKIGLGDLNGLAMLVQSLTAMNYAQYQEFEADTAGLRMAAAAGYDPKGINDLFLRVFSTGRPPEQRPPLLEELVRLPVSVLSAYFRSHPITEERVRRLNAWVVSYERNHKGERVYRGVDNFSRRTPRAQQEVATEFRRI